MATLQTRGRRLLQVAVKGREAAAHCVSRGQYEAPQQRGYTLGAAHKLATHTHNTWRQ